MSEFVVAIDGPAGSGKSSVSRKVAIELGFGYLDTGAAYRALTWWLAREHNFDLALAESGAFASKFDYSIATDPNNFWVKVGQTDVTAEIRQPEVAQKVSQVASIARVRDYMRELTRSEVTACTAPGIVVEGRDMTTVVLPDAAVRLLLTADESVRLARRSAEAPAAAQLGLELSKRDESDSRVVDFMNPAPGVTLVDSTELDFDQTVAKIKALITAAKH
jgi:cytidylate kinase